MNTDIHKRTVSALTDAPSIICDELANLASERSSVENPETKQIIPLINLNQYESMNMVADSSLDSICWLSKFPLTEYKIN